MYVDALIHVTLLMASRDLKWDEVSIPNEYSVRFSSTGALCFSLIHFRLREILLASHLWIFNGLITDSDATCGLYLYPSKVPSWVNSLHCYYICNWPHIKTIISAALWINGSNLLYVVWEARFTAVLMTLLVPLEVLLGEMIFRKYGAPSPLPTRYLWRVSG